MSETDGIRVNCICPGLVDTPLVRESFLPFAGLTDEQKAYYSSVAIRFADCVIQDSFYCIKLMGKADLLQVMMQIGFRRLYSFYCKADLPWVMMHVCTSMLPCVQC